MRIEDGCLGFQNDGQVGGGPRLARANKSGGGQGNAAGERRATTARIALWPAALALGLKVEGWAGPDAARAEIMSGVTRYEQSAKKPMF